MSNNHTMVEKKRMIESKLREYQSEYSSNAGQPKKVMVAALNAMQEAISEIDKYRDSTNYRTWGPANNAELEVLHDATKILYRIVNGM